MKKSREDLEASIQNVSETTSLIPQQAHPRKYLKGAEYTACFLVALPTAFLSGLAALSSNDLNSLHSPDDLSSLVGRASAGKIMYAIIAFSASEGVLFFLNKRYLLASSKAGLELLKRTVLTLRSAVCCREVRAEDKASIAENILFYWSFLTSLIFAEIGGKSLSFLGTAGEITGFSLSLIVYFTTRFAGAKMFFRDVSDRNWRKKQEYLDKLAVVSLDETSIEPQLTSTTGNFQDGLNLALQNFLRELDKNWDKLPKSHRRICLNWTAKLCGYALVVSAALPIMVSFIPESVEGIETLTQTTIGADAHYQNVESFTLGTFTTALTLFFYEVNIKDLPKYFFETVETIYEKIIQGEMSTALKMLGLTLVAAGASYCTGLGFKLVAETALDNGYLSYLGGWLSSMIPDGLLVAVTTMLWSHLQEIISQASAPRAIDDLKSIDHVDSSNVRALLANPHTKIAEAARKVGLFKTMPKSADHDDHLRVGSSTVCGFTQ